MSYFKLQFTDDSEEESSVIPPAATTPPITPVPPAIVGSFSGEGGGGGVTAGSSLFPQLILIISQTVSDLTTGSSFTESILAEPVELISFQIKISVQNQNIFGVFVKEILPDGIIYLGNLKIDGISSNDDITDKLRISSLIMGQTKIITLNAGIVNESKFSYGENKLINTAVIYQDNLSATDTAEVVVVKKG